MIDWTEEQQEIFNLNENKKGKIVIKACPGSGKTTSISYRLFKHIQEYGDKFSGIATLSFTNIATKEIEKNYKKCSQGQDITFPHYLNTIDSFVNNYIFLPFGHLVRDSKKRPILVGQPFGSFKGKNYYEDRFDNCSFSKDGKIICIKNCDKIKKSEWSKVKNAKLNLLRLGLANQSDANYFAMKILEEFPMIAKALTKRFPYIIVDEAQDTSDIQMEILNLLEENGLKNLILVGDPNQAIFEWNGANPQLFIDKFKDSDRTSITLSTNFRSSKNICEVISNFSKEQITSALDSQKEFNENNLIIGHEENYNDIIKQFLSKCEKNGIKTNPKNVAVLFRSRKEFNKNKEIINEIWKTPSNGSKFPDKKKMSYSKDLIKGKYLWDNNEYLEGYSLIEKSLVKMKLDKIYVNSEDISNLIEKYGFINNRINVINFINSLPQTKNSINVLDWISETNIILKEYNNCQLYELKKKYTKKKSKEVLTFQTLFSKQKNNDKLNYHSDTVHGVKGQSYDAILLILKHKGASGSYYSTLINNNTSLDENEELRIIYVALTRARYFIQLAVPKKDVKVWKKYFYNDNNKVIQSKLFD
ncbi:UvrD-helicase domain-containing protein [Methanobrevibacter sp. UBA337]|jgi:superfamily I DNA/RNA helicase|uniref:UvrD-helicase domain-containing protein n=1 Tax=Methanobrevibacter sp. UBA337 TaxID=1915480 RepID=UPI0039B8AD82